MQRAVSTAGQGAGGEKQVVNTPAARAQTAAQLAQLQDFEESLPLLGANGGDDASPSRALWNYGINPCFTPLGLTGRGAPSRVAVLREARNVLGAPQDERATH